MALPTTFSQDFPTLIQNANNRASSLADTSGQLGSELPQVGKLLKDAAYKAYSDNQDIVAPLDAATANYYSTPAQAREQFQGIFDPFAREKLVSQAVQTAGLPMLSLSNILGNRIGRISDIIGTGTDAFKTQVLAAQAQADQANKALDYLMKQYQIESDNIIKQQEQSRLAASGSSDNGLSAILAAILGYGQNNNNTPSSLDSLVEHDTTPVDSGTKLTVPENLTSRVNNILGGRANSQTPSASLAESSSGSSPFNNLGYFFSGLGSAVSGAGSNLLKTLAYAGG